MKIVKRLKNSEENNSISRFWILVHRLTLYYISKIKMILVNREKVDNNKSKLLSHLSKTNSNIGKILVKFISSNRKGFLKIKREIVFRKIIKYKT